MLLAGTPEQVALSLAQAEAYRGELSKRGVFIVPLPIFEAAGAGDGGNGGGDSGGGGGGGAELPPLAAEDLRWRGAPEQLAGYREWFKDQLSLTSDKVTSNTGLYVGMRLDGRVRASGARAAGRGGGGRGAGRRRRGRGRGRGAGAGRSSGAGVPLPRRSGPRGLLTRPARANPRAQAWAAPPGRALSLSWRPSRARASGRAS